MTGAALGFVGVGRMGAPMAGRLLDAGHRLTIFDTNDAAVAPLVAKGATRAASPQAVASQVDTVLMSLPTPEVVHAVALGSDGLVHGGKARVVIDLSTTGPRGAVTLAGGLAEKNIVTVDAPVSGGVAGAQKGSLALMVSCPRAVFDDVNPILGRLGKTFFVGEKPGMGQAMKVINNLISVTALAISSEAMALGAKIGLDAKTMVEVINAGSGRNSATGDKIPNFVLPRTFNFGFAIGLSFKDTKLCLDEGEALGVPMMVGNAVRQLVTITKSRYGADADMTTITKCIEEWAGVELKS